MMMIKPDDGKKQQKIRREENKINRKRLEAGTVTVSQ